MAGCKTTESDRATHLLQARKQGCLFRRQQNLVGKPRVPYHGLGLKAAQHRQSEYSGVLYV